MFQRIAVHRFELPAVDGQVSLPVAIQIELAQRHAAFDRRLEDSGRDYRPVPENLSREPDV